MNKAVNNIGKFEKEVSKMLFYGEHEPIESWKVMNTVEALGACKKVCFQND